MKTTSLVGIASLVLACNAVAGEDVPDSVVEKQRAALEANTAGKGFGPQSPRNIDEVAGANPQAFSIAPPYQKMNLCNIHFHQSAEHAGGEFTTYAGNGDGKGHGTGFVYDGKLSKKEKKKTKSKICEGKHGSLQSGDTIELHYVHTTADITPGPTLGACLSESTGNPQLRVETQVFVLVNDKKAADFGELMVVEQKNGFHQAVNMLNDKGEPVVYLGSTTGPSYNEAGSPFQVTWSVRPEVTKVNVETVGKWCEGNIFNEDHAHGVRNLVINPKLLSKI